MIQIGLHGNWYDACVFRFIYICIYYKYYRRKFRSQTSDNMDRWKAEVARVKEEKRRAAERRSEKRKSQKKEDAGARKGRKVAKHCVFSNDLRLGRIEKVGLLKRRVRSQLARWEMKNCTPLWREAHFEAWYKTPHVRTTFGNWDVEKVHAVVARSTFQSQNAKKHTMFGPLSDVAMSKKSTPLWGEVHFQVKMYKPHQVRTTFGSWDVEKVHAVVARRCAKHISKSKCTKHDMFAPLLDVQMPFCVAGARDYAPCQKWAKREGFVAFPKTMAGVGHLKRICKDGFSVADAVQETCSFRDARRSGRWFPARCCILEPPIFRFAGMILRDRCSTSYVLTSLFRGRRSSLDRWTGNIAKGIGTRPSALHSTFHFWRMSRRIASFLMLST